MKKRKISGFLHKYNQEIPELKDKEEINIIEEKRRFSILDMVIVALISVLLGALLGTITTYSSSSQYFSRDFSDVFDVYNKIINNNYSNTTSKKLINGAVKGMVKNANDYKAAYFNKSEYSEYLESIERVYDGVGTLVSYKEEYPIIVDVYNNSPAQDAGLQIGDIITKVDGVSTNELEMEDVSLFMRGDSGTVLFLEIKRGEEIINFEITRSKIKLPAIESYMIDENLGCIKIISFSKNVYKEFKEELERLENLGMTSLIIDLRSNQGGHVDQMSKIAELFLEKNSNIYQLVDSSNNKKIVKDTTKEKRNYSIVVLQNWCSSSISEVLASTLKDEYGAIIVGNVSEGNGLLYKIDKLSTGSYVKLPVARFLTSKGKEINQVGVKPDEEVDISDNDSGEDLVLKRAIEILK